MAFEKGSIRPSCKHFIRLPSTKSFYSDLVEWLIYYNNDRTHQVKMCNGSKSMDTLLNGKRIWAQKNLNQIYKKLVTVRLGLS